MENQTLSLYGRDVLDKRMVDPTTGAIYLSHELAHQWFGDSVGFERWDDIWLAEGFATYASWLWLEHDVGPQALEDQVVESENAVAQSIEPPPGTPGPDHLFGTSVYRRGALHSARPPADGGGRGLLRILRAWAAEHKYGTADTAEFIALAEQKTPQIPAAQLDALFQAWLYGKTCRRCRPRRRAGRERDRRRAGPSIGPPPVLQPGVPALPGSRVHRHRGLRRSR